jgi:hypothetical protein
MRNINRVFAAGILTITTLAGAGALSSVQASAQAQSHWAAPQSHRAAPQNHYR